MTVKQVKNMAKNAGILMDNRQAKRYIKSNQDYMRMINKYNNSKLN